MRRGGLGWALLLLVTAVALPGLLTAPAASADPAGTISTATFVFPALTSAPLTVFRFDGPRKLIDVHNSGNESYLYLDLEDGTNLNTWDVNANSADGKPITKGIYDSEVASSRHLDFVPAVNNSSYGGNGRIDITDIAYDAQGNITRLAMNFAEIYQDSVHYYYGDVLFNEPVQALEASPSAVDFGRADPGQPSSAPLQLTNTTSTPMKITSLTPPAGYAVAAGTCLGATLAPSATCMTTVSFTPRSSGTVAGNLTIGYTGGSLTVALAGTGRASVTQMVMTSQPQDPVGAGGRYNLTLGGGYQFYLGGASPTRFTGAVENPLPGPNGVDNDWAIDLAPVAGQSFSPGHIYQAQRWPFESPGYAGLAVSGRAVGCNTSTGSFYVKQYSLGATGILSSADIFFRQKCDGYTGYLYGEIRYSASSGTDLIEPKYVSVSGPASALGLPTRAESAIGGGAEQSFESGGIFAKASTGAHYLLGAVGSHYGSRGPLTAIGFPTSDQMTSPDRLGTYAHFERGMIYSSPRSGAHTVMGPILTRWGTIGWERSRLGYPTSDEFAIGGGYRSNFQHGYITLSSKTGQTNIVYT